MSETCKCGTEPAKPVSDVAYYFYRPVVTEKICSLNKVHRHHVGTEYWARMRDGREVRVTEDEYNARPR